MEERSRDFTADLDLLDSSNIRADLLNRSLITFLVFGILATFAIAFRELSSKQDYFRIYSMYVPILILIAALRFAFPGRAKIKASIFIMSIMCVTISQLYLFGVNGVWSMTAFFAIILTPLWFGKHKSYVIVLVHVLIVITFAYLYSIRVIPESGQTAQVTSWNSTQWISPVMIFVGITFMMLHTLTTFIQKVLAQKRELLEILANRNAEIESAVAKSISNGAMITAYQVFIRLSHKLNTPIGNIRMYADLLSDSMDSSDDRNIQSIYAGIERQVDNMVRIMNDIKKSRVRLLTT